MRIELVSSAIPQKMGEKGTIVESLNNGRYVVKWDSGAITMIDTNDVVIKFI